MKFCDFLNILYNNSSRKRNKSQYVLELFSALCGEANPINANMMSPFSDALPVGLRGDDSGYRNRLYNGDNPKYNGLSDKIKEHICARTENDINKDIFIKYLDKSISENNMANLCTAFGVSKIIKKDTIFECIYEQFMEYAYNDNDNATFKLKNLPPKDDRPFEEIFNDTIHEFGVESFLESNPTELLDSHFLDDMTAFVGIIQRSYEDENTLHEDEKTSRKMFEFSNTLLEYVKYLKEQMKPISIEKISHDKYAQERYDMPKAERVKYEPPKDNKDFESRTLNYRNELKSLYNEIQSLQQE